MIPVVIDTQIFFTQTRGGASVYWYELMRRMLDDDDIDLHLLVADHPYNNPLFRQLNLEDATLHRERAKSNRQMRLFPPKIPKGLGPDVIFHSSYLRVPVRKNTHDRTIHTVVTLHDFTHQKYFPFTHRVPNTVLKAIAITSADGLICVSENTYRDMVTFSRRARRIPSKIIYNAANEEYETAPPASFAREDLDLATSKPYLLYVGARSRYKNFASLAEIYDELPDGLPNLIAIGGEPPSIVEMRDSRIQYFRNVHDRDLHLLYRNALALVHTSEYEGFGIPVLEAMTAGCPVIALNRSSIPEVLGETGILLEELTPQSFQSALVDVMNPDQRQELTMLQRSRSKQFSWDKSYDAVKDFYISLLNRSA